MTALCGAQRPRVMLVPEFHWSEADDATFLATSYGLTPDEWQHLVLTAWLARREDGKWAAGRCGLAVPRQNGKNGILEVRELFGMVVLGEKILHTAHEVKTARKAFRRLKYFFGDRANDPNARFPELNALVDELRSTNGQEAILLRNGGSIEFIARSKGSGRGFTVDVLVLDEAQSLTDEELEALLPTISSAPLGNPQTIMTGTPPAPGMQGEVFTRTREAGLEGKSNRLSWHEWSVVGTVDIYDRKNWAKTNPALGIRLQWDVVEDELPPGMSAAGFARERLGRWAEKGDEGSTFPPGTWTAGTDVESTIPMNARVSFCVDVSGDRTTSHIAAAGLRADGLPHVEIVASRAGVAWTIEWFTARANPKAPIPVVVQARGAPASSLIDDLKAIDGVEVIEWGNADLGNATARLYDLVKESGVDEATGQRTGLCHLPQPVLDIAAARAVPRILTDGGMAWDRRRSPVDAAPLVAVTGALWHALQREEAPALSVYETSDLMVLD